ncbi:MAG: hypothetical protein IJ315_02680, partial [Firmicutes bacterium]|nr:hypothetical protein [Bacillota bacterium]
MLAYELPEETIVFRAKWAGDDADFSSNVDFDLRNGHSTITVENESWETDWFGSNCYERGTIQEEMGIVSMSDPVKDGDTFEGWLMHFPETMEVDETLYTTAEVLAMQVPAENVVFWAKWASVSMDEYLGGGSEEIPEGMVEIIIEGNGGEMDVDGTTAGDVSGWFPIGSTMTDEGLVVTDPVYWDPTRAFEGWEIYTWQTIIDEEGNSWEDLLPLDGAALLTTTEMLAYELPDETIVFRAKWAGDDADYGSNVFFDMLGGEVTLETSDGSGTTNGMEGFFFMNGTLQDLMGIVSMTDPVMEGANFEGWLVIWVLENGMTFEYDAEGNAVLLTTSEVLAMDIPADDVVFAAKWDIYSLDDYLDNGDSSGEGYVEIDAHDGKFIVDGEEYEIYANWIETGTTLADAGVELTDLTYWDGQRAFEGWQLYKWVEVTGEDGQVWYDLLPVEDAKLLTTEEILNYETPEEEIVFRAVWEGDDADYTSIVEVDGLDGIFSITVEEDTFEIGSWIGGELPENGKTIGENFGIDGLGDPVLEGDTFEGWLAFIIDENELLSLERDADSEVKFYTSEEIIKKVVPEDGIVFAAKWKSIDLSFYLDLESKIETDVEDLPVIDPEKPVEDVTVGVDAEKTEETLGQTAAGVVDTVVAGDEKEIEALKKVVTEEVIDVIVDALEKGADVKVTTSVQVKPLDEDAMEAPEVAADVAAIEKAASSTQTILQFLDLSVEIKAYVDGELEGTGNVSELDEAIVFTVAIPEEAAKVPAGFTRAYFVIYVHDGVTKQIPAKLNEDGTISFNAGEFSTYALAYEDTLITNPNYPATGDTAPVALYVSVMGAAVVGLVLAGLKKRTVR